MFNLHPDATTVFVDAENVAGANVDVWLDKLIASFDADRVGARPHTRRAYAGWDRLQKMKAELDRCGFDVVDVPGANRNEPNSADIHLAVDAVAESFKSRQLETFILLTGDGGLVPLVQQLQQDPTRKVIGAGFESRASYRLIEHCDAYVSFTGARSSTGSQIADTLRRSRSIDMGASTDVWTRAVRESVAVEMAKAAPLSLAAAVSTIRSSLGVAALSSVSPGPVGVAVADALVGTPVAMYRMPDFPETWMIDLDDHIPEEAEVRRTRSKRPETDRFPSFLAGEDEQPGPVNTAAHPAMLVGEAGATRIVLEDAELWI